MAEKKKKTPEEEALAKQRMAEGQAFIQQREKLASQQGTTSTRAAQQMAPQEQARLEGKIEERRQAAIPGQIAKETEMLNAPVTKRIPTGFTDEFGNPTFIDAPLSMVPTEQLSGQNINPIEAGVNAGAGVGAGIAATTTAGTIAGGALSSLAGPIGIAAGAIAFLVKTSIDEKQNVKELKENVDGIKTNLGNIKARASIPEYRDQALIDWRREKELLFIAEEVLKRKTDNWLDDFLGNAGDEYVALESYLKDLPSFEYEFLLARANA